MVSSIVGSSVIDLEVFKKEYKEFSATQREVSRIVEQYLAPPTEKREGRSSIPLMPSVIMLNYLTDGHSSLSARYPNPALTYLKLLRKWARDFFPRFYQVQERLLLPIQASLCSDNQLENVSLRGGYALVMGMLKAFAAKIKGVDNSHKEQHYSLEYAIDINDIELIKEMLNAGYPVNTVDRMGVSLIHYQVHKQSLEIASLLIDRGADVNKVDNYSRTPLCIAAKIRDLPAVSLLLAAGARADYENDRQQTIPTQVLVDSIYSVAKEQGKIIEIFKKLIAAGANVNRQSETGTTLMIALHYGLHEIANYLVSISNRDTINIVDRNGCSALHHAAKSCPSMVASITQLANVNLRDNRGKTALFNAIASPRKQDDAIISLLQAKADPSIRDNEELTPLDYLQDAEERNRIEELIRKTV